jgi:ribosomal protein S18 acetylase RimI-like enzyme
MVRNKNDNKLRTIYVLPEFQGKGIGKMLWEEAKKFSDSTKDTIVEVATYNINTIEFYKKLGFVDTGKRMNDIGWRMREIGASIPEMEMIIRAKR